MMMSRARLPRPAPLLRLVSQSLSTRPVRSACSPHRQVQTQAPDPGPRAFALDVDGVLLRGGMQIPRARQALKYLQDRDIPFVLLTNGGGVPDAERAADLSARLGLRITEPMLVQSHAPFAHLDQHKELPVLVVGGEGDRCREIAQQQGFKNVITTADLIVAYPELWPFSRHLLSYYKTIARPLPGSLSFAAVFVLHDSRHWGPDAQIITDLMLSSKGELGTLSPLNGDESLPNRGYQQDEQPTLYFSNADVMWASGYKLPRLGQGAFCKALEAIWAQVAAPKESGVELKKVVLGKPSGAMFEYAEARLKALAGGRPVTRFCMVGDNPESDIIGAKRRLCQGKADWSTALVETGVYQKDATPAHYPRVIATDALDAVTWVVEKQDKEDEQLALEDPSTDQVSQARPGVHKGFY